MTEIPLLKIVTTVHFVGFLVFQPIIYHSSDAYRCLILLIVTFTRVLFCMLCMCWPLLLYMVSCISIFILQFARFLFSFSQMQSSLIWVLFDAVLMYVLLHSMLAQGFLAFLFLHAYYLSGFWLLFLWCFYVCFCCMHVIF